MSKAVAVLFAKSTVTARYAVGPLTLLIERRMTFAHSPLPLAPGTPVPQQRRELQLEKTAVSRGYNALIAGSAL